MGKKTYRTADEAGVLCPKCGSEDLFTSLKAYYEAAGDRFVFLEGYGKEAVPIAILDDSIVVECRECRHKATIKEALLAFEGLPVEEDRNDNCLAGMKCPECGSLEPFVIECKACVLMHDEGSDEVGNLDWENDSFCKCEECEFHGTVSDFSFMKKKSNDENA